MTEAEVKAVTEVNRYVLAHIGTLKKDIELIGDIVTQLQKDVLTCRHILEVKLKIERNKSTKIRKELRTVHALLQDAVTREMPLKPNLRRERKKS